MPFPPKFCHTLTPSPWWNSLGQEEADLDPNMHSYGARGQVWGLALVCCPSCGSLQLGASPRIFNTTPWIQCHFPSKLSIREGGKVFLCHPTARLAEFSVCPSRRLPAICKVNPGYLPGQKVGYSGQWMFLPLAGLKDLFRSGCTSQSIFSDMFLFM